MTKQYSERELLDFLKFKTRQMGKIPSKKEIDDDETMPSSSTYYIRFGSISKAVEIIDSKGEPRCELSLELFQKFAKEFYAEFGKSPSPDNFNDSSQLPQACYIEQVCKMTWNEFLESCNLPKLPLNEVYSSGINRKRVMYKVMQQLKLNENVESLRKNGNDIIINEKTIVNVKTKVLKNSWKFYLDLQNKKEKPDYVLLVCLSEEEQAQLYLIPANEIKNKTILINSDKYKREKSIYDKFKVGSISELKDCIFNNSCK